MKRKHLNANALYDIARTVFSRIPEHRTNKKNIQISLPDALMSGLAIFATKAPSLLKFDSTFRDPTESELRAINIKKLFGLKKVPSDTQIRTILDPVDPEGIRPAFKKILGELQRGNVLKEFQTPEGHYLIASDGTGHFASSKLECEHCIEKKLRSGEVGYYHQMLGASIVHPDKKQVIPLCPEPILNHDGVDKQDSERMATSRWIENFRKDHPRMKVCIVEDALAANAPHIKQLQKHDIRFIIAVKEGGNKVIFNQVELLKSQGKIKTLRYEEIIGDKVKKRKIWELNFCNGLSLNGQNRDIKVNFLECIETIEYIDPSQDKKGIGTKRKRFTWITDFETTNETVYDLARFGRRRWAIENETFRTLKDTTAYNFEHSYGHGKKNLCTVFAYLTVLAHLIDQTLEMVCTFFQKALKKNWNKKRYLWERMKSALDWLILDDDWETFFKVLSGDEKPNVVPLVDTS